MKKRFLITFGVRSIAFQMGVIFSVVFLMTDQTVIFGQGSFVTRAQFARFSLHQRALVFEPTFARIAYEEQVDPNLLWTICYLETRFRPWLRSPAGAEGLMQFIPATARRFNLFNPFQPEFAIRAAARYVRFLSNRFGGRIDSILAGYNAGEGAVDAYLWGRTVRADKKIINPNRKKTIGGVPPYSETLSYVARGLIVYRMLQKSGKFPAGFVPSVYPPNISQSVARVWLNDNEIGFNGSLLTQMNNPQFWNVQTVVQNQIPPINAVSNNQKVEEKLSQNDSDTINTSHPKEKVGTEANEIYYEPRTGARYKRQGEKIERLPDNGFLVIGAQTPVSPQPNSIRARGTFFGGKILSPK